MGAGMQARVEAFGGAMKASVEAFGRRDGGKDTFRQKKKPAVHNTSRKSRSYRVTQKGTRGRQLDSGSGHKTTFQPKIKHPQ